mgnify:CR=1 FL=1
MKRRSFLKGTLATITAVVAGKSASAFESPVLPEKVSSPTPSKPDLPHASIPTPWDKYAIWTREDGQRECFRLKPGEKVTNEVVSRDGDAYVTVEKEDGEEYSVYIEASPPYRRIVIPGTK